jgi:hypothetical protein
MKKVLEKTGKIAQFQIVFEQQYNFNRLVRISKERKDYAKKNLSDEGEINQFVQDHNFIINTQKKVEILMQCRLSELADINPSNSHDHPQHNIIINPKRLQIDRMNSEYMKSYPSIQQRGRDQFLEGLMKDIMTEIQTVESRKFLPKFQTTLHSDIIAIHLYLATVINFLHSNQMISNEITRKLFEDDKCLSWINKLNLLQVTSEFPISTNAVITDLANQWFWKLKWSFLKGMSIHELLSVNQYTD